VKNTRQDKRLEPGFDSIKAGLWREAEARHVGSRAARAAHGFAFMFESNLYRTRDAADAPDRQIFNLSRTPLMLEA